MASKKRLAATLGAMALTAVLAVGGTLAYISTVTETKTNTFSSGSDIKGWVEETAWDKTHPNGWTDYKPGEATAKDPKLVLEEGSESAWTAMKLTFKDAANNIVPYATFKGYAEHDGINEGWELIAANALGEELYAHKSQINGGEATTTLFDNITVNAGVTTVGSSTTTEYFKRVVEYNADGTVKRDTLVKVEDTSDETIAYYDKDGNAVGSDTLPSFAIDTKGYAIQTAEINYATAKTELIALANTGVEETSSAYFRAV